MSSHEYETQEEWNEVIDEAAEKLTRASPERKDRARGKLIEVMVGYAAWALEQGEDD